MAQEQDSTGTIVRGADGSLYFIRSEVLEACKVTEEDMAKFCGEQLDEHTEVQGFYLSSSLVSQATTFQGPFARSTGLSNFQTRAYTTMCPGTMGWRDASFRVLPGSFRR